jgi:hypothetical protein
MTNEPITETTGPPPIAPAPTSIALFIGWAPSGPTDKAVRIASFVDYECAFGTLDDPRSLLAYALYHFFNNAGTDAFALRIVGAGGGFIAATDAAFVQALNAAFVEGGPVAAIDTLNLICVPGLTDAAAIAMLQAKAVARGAFLIADCEESATVASVPASLAGKTGANAANSALYFPWVIAPDPLQDNAPRAFPPCGFVAGVYARTDSARGVWNAPAGAPANLADAVGLKVAVSEADEGKLNSLGVNCLRILAGPSVVVVVWGARTLAGANAQASEWKYVNVRRLMMFIEQSIDVGIKWAVFEPNGEPLWAKLRASIGNFLDGLWRSGALVGNTPTQAYFVRCDATTMTQADIDNGVINIVIGVAPVYPAEFVIIRISQFAASN